MKENQSLVNKGKMDYYQPDCDLLSDLPLGIIHIILALIPIREAVRTCILSRHWRYIWTSLPQLVFDDRCASKKDESKTKYEDFITRVLFRHNGPIHKFKVHCPFGLPIPLDEWVYFLSRNDIRDLALAMGCYIPDWSQLMRSSIYSCKRLTNLELCNCELDPPPLTFKGFLFLKSLSLERVDMSCNGIESLVFVCPLLESLTLVGLWGPELNISAPNLKYLKLSCYCLKLYLYAPLLVEMLVEMRKDYSRVEHQQQKTSVCNYTNLLGGLTDLEKLTGSSGFSQYLSIGIESCHSYLVFHHLNCIDLRHVNFQEAKERSLVARLLVGSPNLRELNITTNFYFRGRQDASDLEAPYLSFMDFEFAQDTRLEKLRVFTIRDVTGLPLEIEFLKFLLGSSPVLETMDAYAPEDFGSEKEKKKLRDEVLGCSCASQTVKVSLL